jgi:transcriptional regulator with XRE-family HTH domain
MTDAVDGIPKAAPATVGAQLAAAREGLDLTLDDIATRTRIPRRHLEAIEANEAVTLPGVTYAIGFAKTYARTVGLDSNEIARALRVELGGGYDNRRDPSAFEPADPARVPPRLLAIVFVVLAVLVAAGYGLWRSGTFGDGAETRARLAAGTDGTADNRPVGSIGGVSPPSAQPAAPPRGAVVLTATEPVWLRVYEKSGASLFQGEMTPGQRLEVPATAVDPRVRTGRPQALRVTVGGAMVPPLGDADSIIRDVSLKAEALTGRGVPPAPGTAPGPLVPLVPLVPNAGVRP